MLITAGPTHEPIDAVRFIGNRSSGRLGIALADHAAQCGWAVTLLLGPTSQTPSDSRVAVHRFRTTAELDTLLRAAMPDCDVLVMAAAVADYRPKTTPEILGGKFKRMDQTFTLQLEPTPDLLAGVAATKRDDQLVVGFALEPADRLLESATSKLHRKGLDLIVANPLATIDAETIDAVLLGRDGSQKRTPGAIPKSDFAPFLLQEIETRAVCRSRPAAPGACRS
jgi:phosphopantothenoylcysteine decarboxylase/phosphopantothenate--cysteine ligase